MRKSTKFLMSLPFWFIVTLIGVFLLILGVFRFVESRSPGVGPIHDYLEFYVFILALLITIDAFIVLFGKYASMRTSETKIEKYLKKVTDDPSVTHEDVISIPQPGGSDDSRR